MNRTKIAKIPKLSKIIALTFTLALLAFIMFPALI